jgi:hypothetical protein
MISSEEDSGGSSAGLEESTLKTLWENTLALATL